MRINIMEIIYFKDINLLAEFFFSIALTFLVFHGTLASMKKNFPLIQNSIIYLSVLILLMCCYLLTNESLNVIEKSTFNNTIINDFLSVCSKTFICFISACCLLVIQHHLLNQKINNFEYILLIMFSILGLLLLCSSNDLITAYLAIELQTISFYVLAAFKKNSVYSVDAGLKYFILGALSSSFFLFGSSIVYGVTGSTNFNDFSDMFFWIFPGSIVALSNMEEYYKTQSQNVLLMAIINKLLEYQENKILSRHDYAVIKKEIDNFFTSINNDSKIIICSFLSASFSACFDEFPIKQQFSFKDLSPDDSKLAEEAIMLTQKHIESIYAFTNKTPGSKILHIASDEADIAYEVKFFHCGNFVTICDRLPYCCEYSDDYQQTLCFNSPFQSTFLQLGLCFILVSLFFKLAVAPFHLWAPDVYEGSPTSSAFYFSVVPKLAVFVLLCRIFLYSFYGFVSEWKSIVAIMAMFTVFVGSFGGLEQRKIKSLMAYSSISHMGYAIIAFSSGTFESMHMLITYLFVYTISGLCIWSIFLFTRLKDKYYNKHSKNLTDLVLLNKSNKLLALILTTAIFSIAGLPPMIGFIAKIGIFLSAIETGMYFLSIFSILCSVVATFYYIRIVKILYFENVLVGKLYYPIESQKAVILVLMFYLLIYLFINPSLLLLLTYKICIFFFK